jgi:hypothetical protein
LRRQPLILPAGALFFVALAVTGRTGLAGGALGVVGQVILGAAPFGAYLTNTFDNLLALTGWAGGMFFFSHVFLLLHELWWKTPQTILVAYKNRIMDAPP